MFTNALCSSLDITIIVLISVSVEDYLSTGSKPAKTKKEIKTQRRKRCKRSNAWGSNTREKRGTLTQIENPREHCAPKHRIAPHMTPPVKLNIL